MTEQVAGVFISGEIARAAQVRGFSQRNHGTLLVERSNEKPQWSVSGEPPVSKLLLNLAVDQIQ